MIKRTRAVISKMIIHKVGNKFNEAVNVFSEQELTFDKDSYEMIFPYLLKPFANVAQSYRFNHHANVDLNEMNSYASQIFEDPSCFTEMSKHVVTHLYEQSNSAQIKTGDVLVAYIEELEYKDNLVNAIGVFKIENKSSFFQTYMEEDVFDVYVQEGISPTKLDKGCLILNTADTEGKVILSVDNNNYDAQYWTKHFLNVKFADDSNQHTQNYISLCKDFSEEVIKEDFGNHEKNKFLAKTVDYFKENETITVDDFKDEVFEIEDQKDKFEDYKKQFETLNDVLIRNTFDVADVVVKKEKTKMKTDIKLDTRIHIKVDVDSPDAAEEYMEKGYDEEKKMKYYKVYFNEEK